MSPNETRVPITSEADIVTARQKGRSLAVELGFQGADLTLIATAISEVSRNIVEYAQLGEIILQSATPGTRRGLCIVAGERGRASPISRRPCSTATPRAEGWAWVCPERNC